MISHVLHSTMRIRLDKLSLLQREEFVWGYMKSNIFIVNRHVFT